MKKQLLILIVAFVAISFSTAYGQNAFDPPTCTATALTPAAGATYNYAATISGPGYDGTGDFTWYVTQNTNLLNAGAIIANNAGEIIASGGGSYNTAIAGPAGNNIDIIWTSAALANGNPYYLVVKYSQANSTTTPPGSCTAENLKVYRIIPINTFWLRIESVADAAGAAGGVEQCAAPVIGANITEPAGTVEYTYGQNVLYVKVTASGYTGDWDASLQLTNIVPDQAIGAITWTVGALNGAFAGTGPYTATLPSTVAGTEIIITIPIDNNHHEARVDQTVAVAIDGSYTSGTVTFNDRWNASTAPADQCVDQPAYLDTVDKIIKARPTIAPVAPNTFVPEPTTLP